MLPNLPCLTISTHPFPLQVRQASRDAALREVKERAKKAKEQKVQASSKGQSKGPVAKAVKGKGLGSAR